MAKKPEVERDPAFGYWPTPGLRFSGTVAPPETPAERAARIRRESDDADHRRWSERFILRVAAAILGVAFAGCLWITLNPGYPPERSKLAETVLTMIVSGCVSGYFGFLAGKNQAR
jgi:hypothetical protein